MRYRRYSGNMENIWADYSLKALIMKVKKLRALIIATLLLLLVSNNAKSATANNPMTQDLNGGGFRIFNVLDVITTGPWIDARSYNGGAFNGGSIQAAINAAGGAERTIWLAPGTWQISSNLTIPSNITLKIERGAILKVFSGITLLIQGKIEAGLYELFDTSSGGKVDFSWANDVSAEVYPQWWGAIAGQSGSTYTTKNTQAFRAACSIGGASVVIPAGNYYIDDTIQLSDSNKPDGTVGFGSIHGNGASIYITDSNRNIMEFSVSGVVSNITFCDGAVGVYISTDNVDETVIKVVGCTFFDQSVAGIGDDGDSNNTLLIVNDCKFSTSITGAAIDVKVDEASIADCWITVYGEAAVINRGTMKVRNFCGVPVFNDSNDCWFRNYGNLCIENTRFGGEFAGRCIVENYAGLDYTPVITPSYLYIENSDIYTTDYVVKFYDLPNRFILRNNAGYSGNYGLYLDPAIPSDTKQYFPLYGYFDNTDMRSIDGTSELTGLVDVKDVDHFNYSTNPLTTDLVHSVPTGAPCSETTSSVSVTGVTYPYNGIPGRLYEAYADGGSLMFWYSPSSALFANDKLYTAVVDFVCDVNEPISVDVSFGDSGEHYIVNSGQHVLSVPYFWSTGKSTELKFAAYELSTGDAVHTGRWRIFKNNHTQKTVNTILYGAVTSSVPSGSNITFATGDEIIHMNSGAGGYEGKQCVTAGTPGTWKTFGQISP